MTRLISRSRAYQCCIVNRCTIFEIKCDFFKELQTLSKHGTFLRNLGFYLVLYVDKCQVELKEKMTTLAFPSWSRAFVNASHQSQTLHADKSSLKLFS